MENTAKVICVALLGVIFVLSGCKENKLNSNQAIVQVQDEVVQDTLGVKKNEDSIKCANDPKRFTDIKSNLLFKDSVGAVFLRVRRDFSKIPKRTLNECQKIPFVFLREIGLPNDSIAFVGDIVDIESFKKFRNTETFYYDKNSVYVYQLYPVSYPPFSEIELNANSAKVIDSLYIKDDQKVYYKGIRLHSADAKSFSSRTYRDSLGEKMMLIFDKDSLYHLDKPYSAERLNYLPLYKKQRDSLRAIYFR